MKNLFTIPLLVLALALPLLAGCGSKGETGEGAKPTLNLEGKTLDEKIAAVQADPSIPPNYKETYIKSLRDQAAGTVQPGAPGTPAAPPTGQ